VEIDDFDDDPDSLDVQAQVYVPEDEHLACVQAISEWPILALGKRPVDWLAHRLLTNNLLRDFRLRQFQHMVQEPDEWILVPFPADKFRAATAAVFKCCAAAG
jgi:hypothetical protein